MHVLPTPHFRSTGMWTMWRLKNTLKNILSPGSWVGICNFCLSTKKMLTISSAQRTISLISNSLSFYRLLYQLLGKTLKIFCFALYLISSRIWKAPEYLEKENRKFDIEKLIWVGQWTRLNRPSFIHLIIHSFRVIYSIYLDASFCDPRTTSLFLSISLPSCPKIFQIGLALGNAAKGLVKDTFI